MAQSSVWSVTVTGNKASLQVSIDGGAPQNFSIKGTCYSPCPINGSNGDGPALGDWFWDSFSGPGYDIKNWHALWERDLANLAAMGVNTIRVYNMMSRQISPKDGTYPDPWNGGHLFTHTAFLDACAKAGLHVLVGIALSPPIYRTDSTPLPHEIDFWTNVLPETAKQLGTHPAVLGFVLMNEFDAAGFTYPNSPDTKPVEHWWSQVEAMAAIAKKAAPGKLTTIAVHDDPKICGHAASYMAQCPSIDFWGVNSYQTQNFAPVFGKTPDGPGYGGLTGPALKPVLLTEWGIPATTRTTPSDPSTICQTDRSIANVAKIIESVLPQAYIEPLSIGLCYFEYCDEWWNQAKVKNRPAPPNKWTWWGGADASGFPNGYWDQEGFGLYQTIPGAGKGGGSIWSQNGGYGGPVSPFDSMNERKPMVDAVKEVFAAR